LGKARKLRSLLANVQDTADLLRTVMDRGGATALHQVSAVGESTILLGVNGTSALVFAQWLSVPLYQC
jgi:hypothetical protein